MAPDLDPLTAADSDTTPLIAGRINGIRAWSVIVDGGSGQDLLAAISGDVVWPVGEVMEARCVPGGTLGTHPSPAPKCSCGIYSHHPFAVPALHWFADEEHVLGVIEAWGRVEVHESGFRAQFARPDLLLLTGDESDAHRKRVQALAKRYGVGCRTLSDGEEIAEFIEEETSGLTEDVVEQFLAAERELILEPECVGYLTKRGKAIGGHGLAVQGLMEESPAPYKPEVSVDAPGTRVIRVAGTSFKLDAIQGSAFDVGRPLRLVPEPTNEHDPGAIAVWDAELELQAGYLPRAIAPEIGELLERDRIRTVRCAWEWRDLRDGRRFGLHLIASTTERVRFADPEFKAWTAWDETPF